MGFNKIQGIFKADSVRQVSLGEESSMTGMLQVSKTNIFLSAASEHSTGERLTSQFLLVLFVQQFVFLPEVRVREKFTGF